MKIRTGFVTNSSSSNFIVYIKDIDSVVADVQNPILLALWNFFLTCFNSGNPIKTQSDLIKYLMEQEYFSDVESFTNAMEEDDWLKNEYEEGLKWLNDGYIINYKRIEYGETCEAICNLIESVSDGDNIIVKSLN